MLLVNSMSGNILDNLKVYMLKIFIFKYIINLLCGNFLLVFWLDRIIIDLILIF